MQSSVEFGFVFVLVSLLVLQSLRKVIFEFCFVLCKNWLGGPPGHKFRKFAGSYRQPVSDNSVAEIQKAE